MVFNQTHAWKLSKYEVFSGPNTEKYGPEKTPYLNTFHAVTTHVLAPFRTMFHFWKTSGLGIELELLREVD